MPDLSSFDLKTLAGWAALIVYAIYHERNTIKAAIARYYGDKQLDATDKREAHQDIQSARVHFELQERTTRESREWAEQAFGHAIAKDLMHEMLNWAKGDFGEMEKEISALTKEIAELRKQVELTRNDQSSRLTALTGIISQLVDRRRSE